MLAEAIVAGRRQIVVLIFKGKEHENDPTIKGVGYRQL